MSYLLDKKIKRKKSLKFVFFLVVFLILFYFRLEIFNGFSYASHAVFRPVLISGNKLGEKLSNVVSFFISKNSLYLQNINLKSEIDAQKGMVSNYNSILAENISLKEILGRRVGENGKNTMTLAAILSKPNQSLYDTLIIDAGAEEGLKIGDTVFALGNVPIGRVGLVYPSSSKLILFSNPGEKTSVVATDKNIFMQVVGRGGGNFEMIIPSDFRLAKGDEVILPGIAPYVLGIVETIISDPRDPFIKALLISPVNIQELRFVQVEIK